MAKRVRASSNNSKTMGSDSADRDAELHDLTIAPLPQDESADATEKAAVAARVATRSRATGAQAQTGGEATAMVNGKGKSTSALVIVRQSRLYVM